MAFRQIAVLNVAACTIGVLSGCQEGVNTRADAQITSTVATTRGAKEQANSKRDNEAGESPLAETSVVILDEFKIMGSGVGIYFEPAPEGIRVSFVAPNSSAAEAEIRIGDVVERIDSTNLAEIDPSSIAELLNGEEGQQRSFQLKNGRTCKVSCTKFTLRNLGSLRPYDATKFAEPDLSGLDSKVLAVARLIIDGKYRAATRILETLSASESANGSFYLTRAILKAANHGMLTSDCRNYEPGTEITLTDRIVDDVNLAIELDSGLKEPAAELLCWLSAKVVVEAANQHIALTSVEADDYYRWSTEQNFWYRSKGDWLPLFRKGQALCSAKAARYLSAFIVAEEAYDSADDIASACFLRDVLTYRYSDADANNASLNNDLNAGTSALVLNFLTDAVRRNPELARYAAAVFNARCSDHGRFMLKTDKPELTQFVDLLKSIDRAAAAFAVRYHTYHRPPVFDRLQSPMDAYLYHMEAFLEDDWEGFSKSSDPSALKQEQQGNDWAKKMEENPLLQQLMAFQVVTSGLLPEFTVEAASREPLVIENQHGVKLHLVTMNLNQTRFDYEVKMIVPMSARQRFPTVESFVESLGVNKEASAGWQTAIRNGREDELVIGIVCEAEHGVFQVLNSAALILLDQLENQ